MSRLQPVEVINISRLGGWLSGSLSWFGLISGIFASVLVLINDALRLDESWNSALFLYLFFGLILGYLRTQRAFAAFVLLLPILPTLHLQLETFFGGNWGAQASPGLDLGAAFIVGATIPRITSRTASVRELLPPWQISPALLVVMLSSIVSVFRTHWQAAVPVSMRGLLFNIMHFRRNSWHDDYIALTDWIAYAIAGGVICVSIPILRATKYSSALIFRSLVFGLWVAIIFAVFQARTGIGIPAGAYKEFRLDWIGFAAFGFQPDIHAFSSHMLIGTVGLLGYLWVINNKIERVIIWLTILGSWTGLILSKSRGSLLISIAAYACMGIAVLVLRLSGARPQFRILFFSMGFGCVALWLAYIARPIFPEWVIAAFAALHTYRSFDYESINELLGQRPDHWATALRMFLAFPLTGIGQGQFFRLSSIFEFGGSARWANLNGENAHNYFLQTITETGLVGGAAFIFLLIYPWMMARSWAQLRPAAAALFAVGLGNVFAHSLLIRENLLLASTIVALSYSISEEGGACVRRSLGGFPSDGRLRKLWKPLLFASVLVLGIVEVIKSFGVFPFIYGRECYLSKQVTIDGWTTGRFEFPVPPSVKRIVVSVDGVSPNVAVVPLEIRLTLYDAERSIVGETVGKWQSQKANEIEVDVRPMERVPFDGGVGVLSLSRCFTPRDAGLNFDVRRLGVLNPKVAFYY